MTDTQAWEVRVDGREPLHLDTPEETAEPEIANAVLKLYPEDEADGVTFSGLPSGGCGAILLGSDEVGSFIYQRKET
mgnify:CR=1 FL=1